MKDSVYLWANGQLKQSSTWTTVAEILPIKRYEFTHGPIELAIL
jgi:hypothetical protein